LVDQQVEPARQVDGLLPELLAEAGVDEIAGKYVDAAGRQLGGQLLESVKTPGRRQHGDTPILNQLPDHFPSQTRRCSGDECMGNPWHRGMILLQFMEREARRLVRRGRNTRTPLPGEVSNPGDLTTPSGLCHRVDPVNRVEEPGNVAQRVVLPAIRV